MRRAARKDTSDLGSNEVLTEMGIDFSDKSALKHNCDKEVFYGGHTWQVEFKSRENATKAELADPALMLTPGEYEYMEKVIRNGCRYIIAWDVYDLLEQIGATA